MSKHTAQIAIAEACQEQRIIHDNGLYHSLICIFTMAEEKSINEARSILRIIMEKNLARCRQSQGQIGCMRSGRVSSLPHRDPELRPGLFGRVPRQASNSRDMLYLAPLRHHSGRVPNRPAIDGQPSAVGSCRAQRACPAGIHLGARGRRRLAAGRSEPPVAPSSLKRPFSIRNCFLQRYATMSSISSRNGPACLSEMRNPKVAIWRVSKGGAFETRNPRYTGIRS